VISEGRRGGGEATIGFMGIPIMGGYMFGACMPPIHGSILP
jgi:hypothetical protein